MPDEYISRKAAAKLLGYTFGVDVVRKLHEVPAADVAEVVRCEGCKHRTESGNCGHPRHHGILPSAYPYDFCNYGERREEP